MKGFERKKTSLLYFHIHYTITNKVPASVAQQNSRGDSAVRKNVVRTSAKENLCTTKVVFAHFFVLFLYSSYVYGARC